MLGIVFNLGIFASINVLSRIFVDLERRKIAKMRFCQIFKNFKSNIFCLDILVNMGKSLLMLCCFLLFSTFTFSMIYAEDERILVREAVS